MVGIDRRLTAALNQYQAEIQKEGRRATFAEAAFVLGSFLADGRGGDPEYTASEKASWTKFKSENAGRSGGIAHWPQAVEKFATSIVQSAAKYQGAAQCAIDAGRREPAGLIEVKGQPMDRQLRKALESYQNELIREGRDATKVEIAAIMGAFLADGRGGDPAYSQAERNTWSAFKAANAQSRGAGVKHWSEDVESFASKIIQSASRITTSKAQKAIDAGQKVPAPAAQQAGQVPTAQIGS